MPAKREILMPNRATMVYITVNDIFYVDISGEWFSALEGRQQYISCFDLIKQIDSY